MSDINSISSPKLNSSSDVSQVREQTRKSEEVCSNFDCYDEGRASNIPSSSKTTSDQANIELIGSSNNVKMDQMKKTKAKERIEIDDEVIEDYLNNISDDDGLFNMELLKSILNLNTDDSSGNDEDDWNVFKPKIKSKSKKNKDNTSKDLNLSMVEQLREYNDKFTDFIKQKDINIMQLPPINNKIKVKVINLTKLYNLKVSQKSTKNRKKYLLIQKTPTSNYITEGVFLALCKTNNPRPNRLNIDKAGNIIAKSVNNDTKSANLVIRQSDPDRRIDEGNKGHKLLSKLGWTPGTSIGANNTGILDPVEAYKIKGRSGLGFN